MKLLSSIPTLSRPALRTFSSKFNPSEWHTVTLKDGTLAAWHPQKQFSYQFTQAIDLEAVNKEKEAIKESQSADAYSHRSSSPFKEEGPDNSTLTNLFAAGKTEFKTRSREARVYQSAAPIPKRK